MNGASEKCGIQEHKYTCNRNARRRGEKKKKAYKIFKDKMAEVSPNSLKTINLHNQEAQ